MRLLDFALRQVDKGYEPWSRAQAVRNVVLAVAIMLGLGFGVFLLMLPSLSF